VEQNPKAETLNPSDSRNAGVQRRSAGSFPSFHTRSDAACGRRSVVNLPVAIYLEAG